MQNSKMDGRNLGKYTPVFYIALLSIITITSTSLLLVETLTPSEFNAFFILTGLVIATSVIILLGIEMLKDGEFDIASRLGIITMFASLIPFMIVTGSPDIMIYYDDCQEIIASTDIILSTVECSNYAINNSGLTGMEILEHFEQKEMEKVEIDIKDSALYRPLNP